MSTLTKIVSLAKKLKKEAPNKFAKWTDYIKEASKKIKPVVKKAKKVAKKVTKKVKKKLGETHTDSNSHNVKLSIYSGTGLRKDENTLSYAKPQTKSYVSGVNNILLDELNRLINEQKKWQIILNNLIKDKNTIDWSGYKKGLKSSLMLDIAIVKGQIFANKQAIKKIKNSIK